jgi:hypothetical protein
LLLGFEFLVTLKLWLTTQRFPARLAKAEAEGRAYAQGVRVS